MLGRHRRRGTNNNPTLDQHFRSAPPNSSIIVKLINLFINKLTKTKFYKANFNISILLSSFELSVDMLDYMDDILALQERGTCS